MVKIVDHVIDLEVTRQYIDYDSICTAIRMLLEHLLYQICCMLHFKGHRNTRTCLRCIRSTDS